MTPLELALNHSHDALVVISNENIVFSNRTFSKISGIPEKDLLNTRYSKLFNNPEEIHKLTSKLSQGIRFTLNLNLPKKTGETVPLEAHFSPHFNESGNLSHWAISHTPLKDRQQIQNSIHRLADQLNLVSQNAPLSTWSINNQGFIKFISGKNLPGISSDNESLIDKSIFALYPNDPIWITSIKNALEGSTKFSQNLIALSHYETFFAPVINPQGEKIGLTAVSLDITERVISEESRNRLTSILEATTDTVILFDNENITYINSAGKNLLNINSDSPKLQSFFPETAWQHLQDIAFPQASNNNTWSGESVFLDSYNTEIPISLVIIAHKNQDGQVNYFSTIARDIRSIKENEHRLKEAKEHAEAATRAKSEFLANMSHEIRTPLNAILGFSEILTQSTDDPALHDYTQAIRSSGKNLLHLISDILDLSKIESGNLELQLQPTSPHELIKEIQTIFELQSQKKGLQFSVESALSSPLIHLDATRLRQVLFNLTGNAIKYTQNGFVKLSCSETLHNNLSTLTFEVSDSGQGISPEHQSEIFDTFVQKHDQSGGAGLGLAITQRLVNAMGGQISLQSTPDKGSTFSVTIPNLKTEKLSASATSTHIDSDLNVDFNNASILIADDLETNIQILRAFLADSNLHIIEASNGFDAIKMTELYQPNLILMDIKMPDMDGHTATTKLSQDKKTSHIPIIALTAQPLPEEERKIRSAGAASFLRKPISRSCIISEIKKFLHFTPKQKTPIPLPIAPPTNPQEILDILQGDLFDHWSRTKSSTIISEIKSFASELHSHALALNFPPLTHFSSSLNSSASAYNTEESHKILSQYPNLIDQLKPDTPCPSKNNPSSSS